MEQLPSALRWNNRQVHYYETADQKAPTLNQWADATCTPS